MTYATLTLPKGEFQPVFIPKIGSLPPVKAICKRLKAGYSLRVTVRSDVARMLGLIEGSKARMEYLIAGDHVFVKVLPSETGPLNWYTMANNKKEHKPLAVTATKMMQFPAAKYNGSVEFGEIDGGLFFALPVGENPLVVKPSRYSKVKEIRIDPSPELKKELSAMAEGPAQGPCQTLRPESVPLKKSEAKKPSKPAPKPAQKQPPVKGVDLSPAPVAAKPDASKKPKPVSAPGKMADGIGPISRKRDGSPDWQIAHDDLILLMYRKGAKQTEVYEALGRMVTSAEIGRRHRALIMRAGR